MKMSWITGMIPKAWIKGLVIAAIAAICGWGSNAILEQEGTVLYSGNGFEIVVTGEMTTAGTNLVARIESWLNEQVDNL